MAKYASRSMWMGLIAVAAMVACSSGGTSVSGPVGAGIGEGCLVDADCRSGMCDTAANLCTEECDSLSDCWEGVTLGTCMHTSAGLRCGFEHCSAKNDDWKVDSNGNVCTGVRLGACELTGGCGCTSCEGDSYCDYVNAVCVQRLKAGEKCTDDKQCSSGYCSSKLGSICTAPLGEPCTDENCEVCREVGTGTACSYGCYLRDYGDVQGTCPDGFWCGAAWNDPYSNLCLKSCTSIDECPPQASCMTTSDRTANTCATQRN